MPSSDVDESSCSSIFSYHPPQLSKFLDVNSTEIDNDNADDVVDGDDPDDGQDDDNDNDDREGVIVSSTSDKVAGHRVWDKRYYCLFCENAVSRLPRHLYSAHADELTVAEIMSADKAKKQALLTKVRNLGNERHNRNVLTSASGDLAVVYRPNVDTQMTGSEYIPCEYCHGYFNRRQLWRHAKKCICKPDSVESSGHPVAVGDLLVPHKSDETTAQLLSGMKKGMEFLVVNNDRLIQRFAQKLSSRVGHSKHHQNYIRSRLRKLAKLLIHIRRTNSALKEATLQTVIAPKYFRTVLEAVKKLAGYSSVDHTYTTPSFAINIGHDLKKCATVLKSIGVEEENQALESHAQAFIELYLNEWNDEISGSARRLLQNRKMNKPQLLPLASDVSKLTSYLKDVHAESLTVIKKEVINAEFCAAFKSLAESVLAQLILFNRRRQGEVSKILISQVTGKESEHSQDIQSSLSPLERELIGSFTRIEIPGKRNNIVPVLLTKQLKAAVDKLVDTRLRHEADIADDNVYVFAAMNRSLGYIRGSDVLRKFSTLCGASNPQQLRSTSLRKHIATLSQVMNLQKYELDQVARFLGHDVRIHRQFYRLPSDVMQTAKVAKILIAMERGDIDMIKGKSLDEVDIGPNDGILYAIICYY